MTSEVSQPAQDGIYQPGEGWEIGADGMPFRRAARVVLLDPDGRVLLVRGHDADQPDRSWWFTVGGGIDAGESARDAAVREVFEEAGLRLDPEQLVGPVATRTAEFDFFTRTVRQSEVFFLAHVSPSQVEQGLTRSGWTEVENSFMDEISWRTLAELEASEIEIFPRRLADLVRGLSAGWDGVVVNLGSDELPERE